MKNKFLMMISAVLLFASMTAYAQMIKRTDVVWARNASGPITLDGKLNEADWAMADSIKMKYGQSSGMPGSGWWWQNGLKPGSDPTDATLKFLVRGDSLYLGIVCKDKSVGAVANWAHFDEFLMDLKYPIPTGLGTPGRAGNTTSAFECSYGFYCGADWGDTLAGVKGGLPGFMGFAGSQNIHPRPDSLKVIWDAVTTVQGTSNDDATPDTSWTTEFVFNLSYWGYHPQQVGGDIAMFSMSLWDNDYEWPLDTLKQSSTATWLQGPWANNGAYCHERIYMDPNVTTSSGPTPTVGPDWVIPVAGNFASPVIDGKLDEAVWKSAPTIQMKYGDAAIREAYPSTMKWRSGQSQPVVNGATNTVIDPNLDVIKYFVKADTLFLGFSVKDKFVQGIGDAGRVDGFDVMFNDRSMLDPGDSIFPRRDLSFRVDSAGATKRMQDLGIGSWDSLGTKVRVMIALNPGTTVDTMGTSADSGYTAEMAIDLSQLGYSPSGDGVVFFSILAWDGDSFQVQGVDQSYGTYTWIGRPDSWHDSPAWFWVDQGTVLSVNQNGSGNVPKEFELLGNYPNPFNPTTSIEFALGRQSEVRLDVFDILGRLVSSQSLGIRQPGEHSVAFNASNLASGSYFYRLKMMTTGATVIGKMTLLK